MECLLVIVIAGAVVLAIVGSIRIKDLGRRLDELNARLQRLEAPQAVPVARIEPIPVPAQPIPIVPVPPAPEPVPVPEPVPAPVIPPPLSLPETARAPGLGARLRALADRQEGDRPAASLEERLGARLPVWIGSIALALAGAFLVKYSFDQGLLSPPIRVALGVVFGVVLLAAGEWMRRSSPAISQGLSAAGIADLFACFLAAVNLYQLISPAVGFAFMALTAIVAVLLSLRQGVMVALIGLAGGFLTPALIRTGEPDARNLFGYLLVLVIAVAAVSWSRGWRMVTAFAWVGGLLWVLVWLKGPFEPGDGLWLSLFLIASAVAAVVADLAQAGRAEGAATPWSLWLSWGTLAAAIAALALVTGASGYTPIEWGFLALLAAGILVLARLRPAFEGLAWVAAASPVVLLAAWGYDLEPADTGRFLWTTLGFGLLLAGGAYLAHRGALHPGRWASLSAASGLVLFLLAWASTRDEADLTWGLLALGLAAVYLIAALPVVRRRELPGTDAVLAALAVAVTTFASLAVPLELENQWLTVAWALEVAALTWLSGRLRLPALLTMARLLAVLTAVRLLLNPEVFNYPIGEHPLFNWLLYGYGVPLLAFAAGAWLARRQEQESWARQLEWGSLAFGTALVTLEIRQVFHPGEPGTLETGFLETGTIAAAWLLLGWGLLIANRTRRLDTLELAGRILLAAGAALAIAWPVLLVNPLWDRQEVGTVPVFNFLLWAYGLPAALAVLGARELRPRGSRKGPALLAVTALVLTFVLVSLEVRQAFHGTYLLGPTSVAEQYSYSAAWVLFGILLLVLGAVSRGQVLRRASLVVMMLAVGKVFLYDTANLSDLYRVFSFLGLGLSLLLLAWVYQRFVFVKEPR